MSKSNPTGEFQVSAGYSTSDGFLAEVSVSEHNLLGAGLYGKASVQYGQYARGFLLCFWTPTFRLLRWRSAWMSLETAVPNETHMFTLHPDHRRLW